MEHITIRAFRAVDEKDSCARYIMEFVRVLEHIGVTGTFKPDVSWCADPDSIVFVAEHPTLGMVGGIRLQRARPGTQLPMEKSLMQLAPELTEHLAPLLTLGNAELGALWNSHRFAGRGVPHLLISAAVSMANQLELGSMVCLVAQYIAPYCSLCGFRAIEEVGERGEFVFPIPTIKSYAMMVPDTRSVELADTDERRRILSLRMRPQQTRTEQPKQEQLRVTYDLLMDEGDRTYRDLADLWSSYAA